MARSFYKKRTLSALSELNVTPLIDLAFCLLIIFMVTTPLLEQSIPIKLPTQNALAGTTAQEKNVECICIDKNGSIALGKEFLSLTQLESRLAQIALASNKPTIHLRADAGLAYQRVIDVIDLLKKHKLSKLSLDTQATSSI